MAEIPSDFGVGGSGLAPRGGHGKPSLVEILNDIADDLAEVGAITSPDATDLPEVITLANEMKVALNALNTNLRTTKQP